MSLCATMVETVAVFMSLGATMVEIVSVGVSMVEHVAVYVTGASPWWRL